MDGTVFYFIAQSGRLLMQRVDSNFYIYTLPGQYRKRVEAEAEHARLGSGGLEYSQEFLESLSRWDREGLRLLH